MNRRRPIVAIDGPAGSGKTTVSRAVAHQLGYVVLDTGALYRAVALSTARAGLEPSNPTFERHCRELLARRAIVLEAEANGQSRVWLDGEDVSKAIRTPENSQRTSVVSAESTLRAVLLDLQRQLGREGGVVVEGRDIGSVVFPDAEAKFFLTASVERRAKRRHSELRASAVEPTLEDVEQQVRERDERDTHRTTAPLLQAPDATLLDSTNLSIDQVVDAIVREVRAIEAGPGPVSSES